MLLKVIYWYAVILPSSEIKLQGGLKNNTMDSYMTVVSILKRQQQIVRLLCS